MKKFVPLVLPNSDLKLKNFIEANKIVLFENLVSSIEYALNKNLTAIEVFAFENSDFVITLSEGAFKENIDHVYEEYIKDEKYEYCSRLNDIKKLIEKKIPIENISSTNEEQK